jgi:hypothetical protein
METFRPRSLLNPYFKERRVGEQVLYEGLPAMSGILTAASLYVLLLPLVRSHAALVAALFSVSLITATVVHLLLAWGTLPHADSPRAHFRLAGRLLLWRYAVLSIGAAIGLSMPFIESLFPSLNPTSIRVGMISLYAVLAAGNVPEHIWQREEEERLARRREALS